MSAHSPYARSGTTTAYHRRRDGWASARYAMQPATPATPTPEVHSAKVTKNATSTSNFESDFRSAQLHTMNAATARKWLNSAAYRSVFGYHSNAMPATRA